MVESTPTVAYLTSYYNGKIDGRLGRFHDWIHYLRDAKNPPFDVEVHAFSAVNPDEVLYSRPHALLGDGQDLIDRRLNKLEFLLNVRRVRRDLQRSNFDLLHVLQLDAIIFPTAAFGRPEPLVVGPDILGWNPLRSGDRWDASGLKTLFPRAKFRVKQLAAGTRRYDAVLAHSEYHRRLLHRFGVRDDDIATLVPGVNPVFSPIGPVADVGASAGQVHNESADAGDRPTLLYVGDFSSYKGFPTLLEAVSRLDREVNVVALGEGEPEGFDLDRVNRLNVVGFVERGALAQYYRAADLFVMPSVDEAGPNTILEALACGTPVVATDAPGINEFPPEGTAVFFSPREPGPLTDALDVALDELPVLTRTTESLAAEGRFHIERTVAGLKTFYGELLEA